MVCIQTPGHAPGHLCLFETERRILLGGDMVPGVGTTLVAPPEGDMALYLESLDRLLALKPRLLLPAHGPLLDHAERAISELIQHRRWREARILEDLQKGKNDIWDLTLSAYDDVAPWQMPLATHSTVAHLIKLQREGLVRRVGPERWIATP